jgi:hypothetical protein
MTTFVNWLQYENASPPIVVTLSGILIVLSPELENAYEPIDVILVGNFKEISCEKPWKA